MKCLRLLLLAAVTLAWSIHAADLNSSTEELIGFDKRRERRAEPSPEQKQAHDALRQRVPDAKVEFGPHGLPKWIRAERGPLTGAKGEGKAVTPKTAQRFQNDPHRAVKAFVEEHRGLFGHGPEELDAAVKTRDYVGELNGVRTTVWHQQLDSVPVYEAIFTAHVDSRGELMDISSQFVPHKNPKPETRNPKLAARRATEIAAKAINEPADEITALTPKPEGAELVQSFKINPLPGEATARLVWFAIDRDTLRLAWQVELNRRQFSERFRVLVDAQNGDVLLWRKLTVDIGTVTYRVFTNDSPTPMRPGWSTPNAAQPPAVSQSLVTLSALNTNASPLGWINDGELTLRGNNIDAGLDRDNDNRPDLPRVIASVDAGGHRTFDFSASVTQQPTNYSSASAVQLFYWCNWMHDRLYEIGFTEAKGNFQKDNFGRGGVANDPVIADAQDGSGVNNANFTPAPDGISGRIQMYIFNGPNPQHDGALDAEVVLHEYTHGMSDRRVGHGAGIFELQTWGMSEGWSDFFAEAMLTGYEHPIDGVYPMGGYASYLFSGLQESYYFGIRRYPYCTSTNINPLLFRDIDPAQISTYPGVPRNQTAGGVASEVHRQGEVWCEMLWEVRAALLRNMNVTATNYKAVNDFIMRIIADGMDFTPANPNFIQARDGILTAERTLTGGTNSQVIWMAFAKRGLGYSAVAPDSSTTLGAIAAYDVPKLPAFAVSPDVLVFSGTKGSNNFAPASDIFTLLNQSDLALDFVVNGTAPLTMSPTHGTLPAHSEVPIFVFTNGMEAFPVGDTNITITFTNVANALGTTRTVTVSVKPPNDSLAVTPTSTYLIDGPLAGPFSPASRVYTLQAGAPLSWAVSNVPTWLTITPSNGTLAAGEPVNVTATVNSRALLMASGLYNSNFFFLNKTTGTNVACGAALRIGTEDYFTEDFTGRPFDLQNSTLTLTPAGASYVACVTPATNFFVQPANAIALPGLADDEYRMVTLTNGQQVKFYGQPASALWIGANGNISPDPGSHTDYFYPGLFEFFSAVRVAPLYVDLNPLQGGRVSWQQLSNRLVVTYEDVPLWAPEGTPPSGLDSNNFQIELFYDGIIRITWLKVEAPGALVGISRGASIPANFFSSDLSALSSCIPTGRLVVPAVAREGDGTLQGTVLLSLPNPAPMEVQLSADNINEVAVPVSVTIPAGEVSVNFPITILDDALLDGTQVATIQADFPDRPSATAGIAINDNETTRITIAVPAEAGEGDGVLVDGGFILLGAPADRDVSVQLTSSNSARVIVPSSVIVPAGSRTAFFDVTLVDDELLNGLSEDVSIAAFVTGWQYDKDVITVHDNDAYQLGITLISELAENGGSVPAAGAIILPAVTAVPVTVSLNSDQPGTVFPPPTITVPAGSGSATFPLFVVDNFNTNSFDIVRIDASAAEFLSVTGSLRVLDDERPTAPFSPYPTNGAAHVVPDTALAWTVNPMPIAGTIVYDVYLDTNSSPTTKIGTTTNLLLGLGAQLESGRTYYWRVVSRRDPFSVSSDVWSFTTSPFDHFSISNIPSPQVVGQPFAVTVTARDEYNKIVRNYGGAVSLTNYVSDPPKGKILITEVDTGDSDRVELQNVSDQNVNVTGWQVTFWDAISWPAPKITFTVPTTASIVPGDLFRVRTFSARFAPGTYPNFIVGTNLSWNGNPTNNAIAVLLQDSAGNLVDFFCAVDAFANQITAPFPILPNDWSGAPVPVVPNSQTLTYQRQGNMDHNNASDWTYLPTGILVTNTGIQVPFTSLSYARMISSSFTNFISGVCTGSVVVLDEGQQMYLGAFDTDGHAGSGNRFDVIALNDISVRADAPDSVTINDSFVVSITVTNRGSNSAPGVTVSNAVPFGTTYVSALSSRGSCSVAGGAVVCSLGDLAASNSATVAVTLKANSTVAITNIVQVDRSDADNYLGNNTATTVTLVSLSQVLIADMTVIEPFGDLPGSMTFNVSLLPSNAVPVSVQFFTSDGTAAAGSDYVATNGTLVFPPGTTNQTITVTLLPDALSESNETFTVTLFGPTNVLIGDSQATGTINDNDPSPTLTINDITTPEGPDGTNFVTFSVALSAVSGKISSVAYTTVDASALAGVDYLPAYGIMTFPPGVTNASVDVGIIGSDLFKADRKFYFRLSSPDGLILSRTQAVCVVTDKDTNRLHHLAFEAVPAKAYTDVPFSITGTARDFAGGLVSNFSGPVHLLAADNEAPVTIGSNSLAFEYPLGASYHDSRFQTIYWASELGAPGEITSLSLDVTNVPGITLSNFTIRTKSFVPAQFVTVTWESDGWTTNFQSDITLTSTGWVTFAFRTPCQFDGVTNLLVDFSFNNNSYGSDGVCRSSVVAGMRSIGFRTDSAFGDPLSWSNSVPPPTLFNRIPNTRFTIGRSVAVSPPTISNAFAGVFTSPVALNTPGSNMTLRIVDNDGHYATYSGFTVEIMDSDGDGLPDSWENDNGLNPFDSSDATSDADGDGLTNLQEYLAGTNPRATNSTVRIENVTRSIGDVTITVETVLGKRYELQSSTSLPSSWAAAALPVNGTGGLVPIVHRPPTNDTVRFYRVRVLP